jgi:hypothetical protein
MAEHHRVSDDIDPDIASLARVKVSTWKVVAGALVWLGALTATSATDHVMLRAKADKEVVELQRQADRDLLALELAEISRRLKAVEDTVNTKTTLDEQAKQLILQALREQQQQTGAHK